MPHRGRGMSAHLPTRPNQRAWASSASPVKVTWSLVMHSHLFFSRHSTPWSAYSGIGSGVCIRRQPHPATEPAPAPGWQSFAHTMHRMQPTMTTVSKQATRCSPGTYTNDLIHSPYIAGVTAPPSLHASHQIHSFTTRMPRCPPAGQPRPLQSVRNNSYSLIGISASPLPLRGAS